MLAAAAACEAVAVVIPVSGGVVLAIRDFREAMPRCVRWSKHPGAMVACQANCQTPL